MATKAEKGKAAKAKADAAQKKKIERERARTKAAKARTTKAKATAKSKLERERGKTKAAKAKGSGRSMKGTEMEEVDPESVCATFWLPSRMVPHLPECHEMYASDSVFSPSVRSTSTL